MINSLISWLIGRLIKTSGVRIIQTDEIEALVDYRENDLDHYEPKCDLKGKMGKNGAISAGKLSFGVITVVILAISV